MIAARQIAPKYTVADRKLWKGDWELWDGIAIAMSPSPFGRHQIVLFNLAFELRLAIERLRCDAVVAGELDWVVRNDTVVRPDLIVVCGEPPEEHLHAAPSLVAEILSPSTKANDLGYKRALYHEQGVATYLIVDLEKETIEIDLRQPDGTYLTTLAGPDFELRVCDDCHLVIGLKKVFKR